MRQWIVAGAFVAGVGCHGDAPDPAEPDDVGGDAESAMEDVGMTSRDLVSSDTREAQRDARADASAADVLPNPTVVTVELSQPDGHVLQDGGVVYPTFGPQGSYHVSIDMVLGGGVAETHLIDTPVRVWIGDAEGRELGSGYWSMTRELWMESGEGYAVELPPLFLLETPTPGQRVDLQARLGREDRPFAVVELGLEFAFE